MSDTTTTTRGAARRVLVTGTSRGVGRAIALAFAGPGTRLALLSRPSPAAADTAQECARTAAEVVAVHADVTDEEAAQEACKEVLAQFGGVDVLVNNAGVGRYAPFLELSAADWDSMLRVNVAAVATVTRAVLPSMLEQRAGHIVNIGSLRGIETIPKTTAYAASKFAIVGFTSALRQELEGTGVAVSVISPGGIRTDFGGIPAETKSPSFLSPEAVAEAVVEMVEPGRRGWIRDLTLMPTP